MVLVAVLPFRGCLVQDYLESQLECECMATAELLWRLARAYYDVAEKTVPPLPTPTATAVARPPRRC
jgi:hypothetical protein